MTIKEMTRGDTPIWDLVVTDTAGAPFNLAGYTTRMTAKYSLDDADADAVFQLSSTAGEIVYTDAAGGLATIQPLRSSTSALTTDVTVWCDVQIAEDASPDVSYTVVKPWAMTIKRDVTRTAP
jgi:hypothetical protein